MEKTFNHKIYYIVGLILFAILAGLGFLLSSSSEQTLYIHQLKPKVTTTLTSQKTHPLATTSAFITVDEQVLGAKAAPQENYVTVIGDDLLVLVNKTISLPASYVPADLVSLQGLVPANFGAQLRSEAANALRTMFEAAKNEEVSLSVISAYRSYNQQEAVFNGYVKSAGLTAAENFSAHPGHSQHQLGTAVDLGAPNQSPLSQSFADTKEGVWVDLHAQEYGFVISYPKGKEALTGYMFEPWHYRYIGLDNAKKMEETGLILEAYLRKYGVW